MGASAVRQDILYQLVLRDLKHVLDLLFSYLDLETLSAVEKVSPLWAWLVQSSKPVYRRKVLTSTQSGKYSVFSAGHLYPPVPSNSHRVQRCLQPRRPRRPWTDLSIDPHISVSSKSFTIINRSLL